MEHYHTYSRGQYILSAANWSSLPKIFPLYLRGIHTYIYTHINLYENIYIYIYTHTHTYIHTHSHGQSILSTALSSYLRKICLLQQVPQAVWLSTKGRFAAHFWSNFTFMLFPRYVYIHVCVCDGVQKDALQLIFGQSLHLCSFQGTCTYMCAYVMEYRKTLCSSFLFKFCIYALSKVRVHVLAFVWPRV
jgi:hypothetical protein